MVLKREPLLVFTLSESFLNFLHPFKFMNQFIEKHIEDHGIYNMDLQILAGVLLQFLIPYRRNYKLIAERDLYKSILLETCLQIWQIFTNLSECLQWYYILNTSGSPRNIYTNYKIQTFFLSDWRFLGSVGMKGFTN